MKIAIAGYGVEGQANYEYWSSDISNEITIVDERAASEIADLPEGVPVISGEGVFKQLDGFDVVVRTASLPPKNITTNGKVWSGTNEFFAKCPAPIIGITGTKGKGTTASIIEALFAADGRKTWLVGNIGIAALTVLPQIQPTDIVVYELSSFQLWDIQKSPHSAVVLMIEPDHLNVHDSMEDYVQAKAGIARHQTANDFLVYNPTNTDSARIAEQSKAGIKQRYAIADDGGVYVETGMFRTKERVICSTEALQLRGDHNKENACAAISIALLHGMSNESIEQGLRNFKGLPHRLEHVRSLNGVDYFNDSFSSAPGATVAAVRSFEQPEIVIIGGIDKGADFSQLITELTSRSNVKEVVLIGTMRSELYNKLNDAGLGAKSTVFDGQTMGEIVAYTQSRAVGGDVVILSPGCASFDMFKNFYDRGDQFRETVNAL